MYFYESNYHLELYQYSIIEIDSISNLINFHKDKIKSSNYLSILKKKKYSDLSISASFCLSNYKSSIFYFVE